MILAVAAAVVLALGRLGLPSIVGFLVAGTLVGPAGLGLVADSEHVRTFADIGVVLLLFTIGMEFDLRRLARRWRALLLGGGLQVGLTLGLTVIVAWALGAGGRQAVFLGYLAALSSTAIVMRLLRDRRELDAPHGKLLTGILLFQDLCVVPMVMTLPLLGEGPVPAGGLALALAKAAGMLVAVLWVARASVPWLLARIVALRQRETFLLAILGIALTVALATSALGLSLALGGFLAGVLLAESEYVWQAQSEVTPLRDALAAAFFVSVGMLLDPVAVAREPARVLGIAALLVVGKAVAAGLAVRAMGFPLRVATLVGLGLAQVGEFSFVLLGTGRQLGLVGEALARDVLAASVLTMMAAPVFIAVAPRVADRLTGLAPRGLPPKEEARDASLRGHVVICGLGLAGQMLARGLEGAHDPYVAIEVDPDVARRARRLGRHVRFGDASSPEVLEHAGHAREARLIVLVMSEMETTLRVATLARGRWPDVRVLARVRRMGEDEARLRAMGCEVVVEELEGALDIVERVLRRRSDAVGHAIRGASQEHGGVEGVKLQLVVVEEGDRLAGVTLAASRLRSRTTATVAAVARDGKVTTNPPASLRLQPGDGLLLVGTEAEISQARAWIRRLQVLAPA